MNDERQKLTPEELLQTKDRVLEQWRMLPSEHQATMLLVLLKEIDSADMNDWTRSAIATLYTFAEQTQPIMSIPLVTREKIAQLNMPEQELATLTDEDLNAIAGRIKAAFSHEEFWDELFHQALKLHTEQALIAKRSKPF